MKTTLALLIATLGFTASVFAGPSIPGGFTPPVRKTAPATQGCSMNKPEFVTGNGHGNGPLVIFRSVNCTGQQCCVTKTASCCAGKH